MMSRGNTGRISSRATATTVSAVIFPVIRDVPADLKNPHRHRDTKIRTDQCLFELIPIHRPAGEFLDDVLEKFHSLGNVSAQRGATLSCHSERSRGIYGFSSGNQGADHSLERLVGAARCCFLLAEQRPNRERQLLGVG